MQQRWSKISERQTVSNGPADGTNVHRADARSLNVRQRWALNGDFVTLSPTGVARYAHETVAALDTLVGEGHPLTRGLQLELIAPTPFQLRHIPCRVIPEFRSPRLPQVWVQSQLPREVSGGLVSFCNLAPVSVRHHIACIHDLHTFLMPESYSLSFRLAHRAILPMLGRIAGRITTVSELSRDHIVAHGVAPRTKVTVTYNGSDHVNRWDAGRSTLKIPTCRPFVLALGRPQKYKNTQLIWQIADRLADLGVDILLAGDLSASALAALGPQRPANIYVLGRVGDDDLALLFSKAVCFLFPSRIEGFGIPAVEAMALGCPLVASTSPCLPQICGDGAIYADPDRPDAWVEAVSRLLSQPVFAHELTHRARNVAARYTWRNIAIKYLTLMHDLDAEDRPVTRWPASGSRRTTS